MGVITDALLCDFSGFKEIAVPFRAVEFDQEYDGRILIWDTVFTHQSLKKVFQDNASAFADAEKIVKKEVATAGF